MEKPEQPDRSSSSSLQMNRDHRGPIFDLTKSPSESLTPLLLEKRRLTQESFMQHPPNLCLDMH